MDVYEQLRAKLAAHPMGAPESESILEILRILFSPEEAALALHLPFKPGRDSEIAQRAGLPVEELVAGCEALADRGLVYAFEVRGRHFYMLFPTAPGLFEFPFMKHGRLDLPFERLGKLWADYYAHGWGAEMKGRRTHVARVIPVQETVAAQQTVLTFEEVAGYVERARNISLQDCACRVAYGACDAPLDVCLAFDYGAKYLVERGMGRAIDREEALAVLRRARDAGLVHMTSNTLDRVEFVCNCCACCCGLLGTVTRLGGAAADIASNFVASVDDGACLACGLCLETCPVGAIALTQDPALAQCAAVDPERCIGCGLCAAHCPEGALALVRREATYEPPADYDAWLQQVAEEKGRVEAFRAHLPG